LGQLIPIRNMPDADRCFPPLFWEDYLRALTLEEKEQLNQRIQRRIKYDRNHIDHEKV